MPTTQPLTNAERVEEFLKLFDQLCKDCNIKADVKIEEILDLPNERLEV